MTQHIAVLGIETLEGRVVLSGVPGIEPLGFDDYANEAVQIDTVGNVGSHLTEGYLSGAQAIATKTVIKTFLCPSDNSSRI